MEFLNWLLGTPTGVLVLVIGGMVFFTILAFVLERRTHKMYFNHPESEDEEGFFDSLFADDEDEDDKPAA